MVNATSVLILILILSFAADRIAKAIVALLSMTSGFQAWSPSPEGLDDAADKAKALQKRMIVHAALVGAMAVAILWLYPQIRLLKMLTAQHGLGVIDLVVSAVVIMGGSELIGRLLSVSSVNDAMMPVAGRANASPVEITGKLELENVKAGEHKS